MAERPHILLISADALRYDALGCDGNAPARTPNLDALAAAGTRFARAYCTQPICMPCRASIATGRWPRAHGVWENGVPLAPSEITLPAVLAEAGYETRCVGKAHFRPWLDSLEPDESGHHAEHPAGGAYYGFDEATVVDHSENDAYSRWVRKNYPDLTERILHPQLDRPEGVKLAWKSPLPAETTKTHFIAERSLAAIRSRDKARPLFLWASFIDPHHPYNPPAPFCDWHDEADFPPPPANEGPPPDLPAHYRQWHDALCREPWKLGDAAQRHWLTIRRMYQGKVSPVDHEVGRLLASLDEEGMADDTIVLFCSDHGCMLGGFGLLQVGPYSFESMVHIPMIWRVPGAPAGRSSEALVSAADILPTLLDLAGVEIPLGVQGKSVRGALDGSQQAVRDAVLVEQRWGQDPPGGYKTLITDRCKLSLYADGKQGELYDLQADPQELDNLFGRSGTRGVQDDLTARLAVELMRTEDPLPRREACW